MTGKIPQSSSETKQIARQLYANGYEPVPIAIGSKACYLSGWTTAEFDLDKFFPERKRGGVGIRNCAAIDIDCNDPEVASAVEAIVQEALPPTPLVRVGKAPKTLYVYGRGTAVCGYTQLIERDGVTCRVEILAEGKQFVAFHRHPDTGKAYEWVRADPREEQYDELPKLDKEDGADLLREINRYFDRLVEDHGWALSGGTGEGGTIGQPIPLDRVYYQHPDGYEFNAGDLDALWGQGVREIRCGWEGTRHKTDAGCWYKGPDGRYFLRDHGTGTLHYREGETQEDIERAQLEVIAAAGRALGLDKIPAPPKLGEPNTGEVVQMEDYRGSQEEQHLRRVMMDALENKVFVVDEDLVYNKLTGKRASTRSALLASLSRKIPWGPDGEPTPMGAIWMHGKVNAEATAYRPDIASELFLDPKGYTILNRYRAPRHPTTGGSDDVFQKHIARLVPDEFERTIVLDWISALINAPWKRLVGLLMVAPGDQGTGRGLVFQILQRVLGDENTAVMPLRDVQGQGYQAQYNDWMVNRTLIHIPEAKAHEESLGNRFRVEENAYETLKEVMDPGVTHMHIQRKGQGNTTEPVFYSSFAASNHMDAIRMAEDDRRIIAVRNCEEGMKDFQINEVLEWMAVPENIGAVVRWARSWERTVFTDDSLAPMTDTKKALFGAVKSQMDDEIEFALTQLPGNAVTVAQIIAKLEGASGLDRKEERRRVTAWCRKHLARPRPEDSMWKIKVDGAVSRPWVRIDRKLSAEVALTLRESDTLRAELRKNADN